MIREIKTRRASDLSSSCGQSKNLIPAALHSILLVALLGSTALQTKFASAEQNEIVALHLSRALKLGAAHPNAAWKSVPAVSFSADWQGKNLDPATETSVQVAWFQQTLYLRFVCRYRALYVFADSEPNGRRDQLWDRDVAEVFLQPDPTREHYYKEFEIAPNGMWVDLDIFPGGRRNLQSGMTRSVQIDESSHTWIAELSIPISSLTDHFDPKSIWRVNLFRVEGDREPRRYSAWQPTLTSTPNFHVPAVFGRLRFAQ